MAKQASIADIDVMANGSLKLITPYEPAFVEALKQTIPGSAKKWHPKPDRFWEIDPSYFDILKKLCADHFTKVRVLFEGANPDDPYTVMFLTSDAPNELVKAAYRTLVKVFHPDAGGTHDDMTALNDAFNQIKADRKM